MVSHKYIIYKYIYVHINHFINDYIITSYFLLQVLPLQWVFQLVDHKKLSLSIYNHSVMQNGTWIREHSFVWNITADIFLFIYSFILYSDNNHCFKPFFLGFLFFSLKFCVSGKMNTTVISMERMCIHYTLCRYTVYIYIYDIYSVYRWLSKTKWWMTRCRRLRRTKWLLLGSGDVSFLREANMKRNRLNFKL